MIPSTDELRRLLAGALVLPPWEEVVWDETLAIAAVNALPGLLNENARLRAVNERLVAGLRPFATDVSWFMSAPDSTPLYWNTQVRNHHQPSGASLGDFRRARALIAEMG